jgi:ATP-dependent helicase/nuclease subunit B
VRRVLSEIGGKLTIEAPGGPFTITARADRIDLQDDGRIVVYDYKTTASAINQAVRRDAPQLSLEGMLAARGAFTGVPDALPERLAFILTAGGDPGGEVSPLKGEVRALVEAVEKGVTAHIVRFDDPQCAYTPLVRALFSDKARFDSYAHLARAREWQARA